MMSEDLIKALNRVARAMERSNDEKVQRKLVKAKIETAVATLQDEAILKKVTEALQGLGGYHANTTMAKLPPNFGMVPVAASPGTVAAPSPQRCLHDPDTNLFAPIGKILQEKIYEPIVSSKL
jgi:hypothetical protein